MHTPVPDLDQAPGPDPDAFMRPERLAALVPTRLSASRALINRMSRERWPIEIVRFAIDERARGEALYRIHAPGRTFDFMVFSFEPKLEGRTGRIIGTDWDMMGALVEGEATAADMAATRAEFPKLYAGRATPGTLVWCRSNRSLRLFDHVIERLAAGEQPDADELWRVGYLMRNTGLDGNGTFGTRSYLALEDDHPLRGPYHAQMLSAYLMREFSFDLADHLARLRNPDAVRLAPAHRRMLGLGNGSALGLVFFANNHPALLDRWLGLRFAAVARARARAVVPGSAELARAGALLDRAIAFYADDPFTYHAFTPARTVAAGLRAIAGRLADPPATYGALVDAGTCPDAVEVGNAILLELWPEETDAWLRYQPVDETLRREPRQTVRDLRALLDREYAWTDRFDMTDPAQRRFRWYKSRDAEEPRRGPLDEVPDGFEWALDLPGDVRRLRRLLDGVAGEQTVGELLAAHPAERATVQRAQGLAGRRYHSPHMNMLAADFTPAHVVRLMNAAFHGLDKTVDGLGRNVLGLLFHGAPTRTDLSAGEHADWIYPRRAAPSSADTLTAPAPAPPPARLPAEHPGQRSVLNVSLRECRLVAYRVLWHHGAPVGAVPAIVDAVTAAEGAGLGGLAALRTDAAAIGATAARPVRAIRTGDTLTITAGGKHALAAVPDVLDLVGAHVTGAGRLAVRVEDVTRPDLLAVLAYAAADHGLALDPVEPGVFAARTAPPAYDGPGLPSAAAILRDGTEVAAELWWALFHLGNLALTPDSPVSRRHTGRSVFDAAGRIVGELGEDAQDPDTAPASTR